jgi:hypothetical protein
MDEDTPELLQLLAPGLLHFLGNAVFAAQGRAHLLAPETDLAADRAAILEALERASGGLNVLRWVLGDESLGPQGLWPVLQRLHDALRVSLRERGLRLELRGEAVAVGASVPAAAVTRALLAMVLELLHAAAAGVHATVVVEALASNPTQTELQVLLLPEQGSLPFPLDLRRSADRLQPRLAAENAEVLALPAHGLRLLLRRAAGPPPTLA